MDKYSKEKDYIIKKQSEIIEDMGEELTLLRESNKKLQDTIDRVAKLAERIYDESTDSYAKNAHTEESLKYNYPHINGMVNGTESVMDCDPRDYHQLAEMHYWFKFNDKK